MSQLLEKILSRDNMNLAYKRVKANKGAGGVDGVEMDELYDYIKENWKSIKEQIEQRQYKPQPVRRVEIPKPNGGVRKLGIPTLMDRVIQQAIAQVISPICEPYFSDRSYIQTEQKLRDGDIKTLGLSQRWMHMDSGHRP
jgi:retron-type reverse transcriptase